MLVVHQAGWLGETPLESVSTVSSGVGLRWWWVLNRPIRASPVLLHPAAPIRKLGSNFRPSRPSSPVDQSIPIDLCAKFIKGEDTLPFAMEHSVTI